MTIFNTRTRRRSAALAGGAVLALSGLAALPLVAGSADAAAPTVTGVSVYSGSTSVTSTTGHKLIVTISSGHYGSQSTSVGVGLRTPNNSETHSWSFGAPTSALALDSQGKGTIALSAAKMGGYGVVHLHVSPVAPAKTTSCGGQVVSKSRKVAISGTFHFVTKSTGGHKWGDVGSSSRTFHFSAPSYVSWSYANTATCPYPPSSCYSGTSWSTSQSGTTSSTSLYGGTSGKRSSIYGSRSVQLAKPAGASRYDYVNVSSQAAQLTTKPDGSARLKQVFGHGSAVLAAPTSYTSTRPCGSGSKSENSKSWSGSYTNGSTPLKLPAQIFGALFVKSSANSGYFSRTTIVG